MDESCNKFQNQQSYCTEKIDIANREDVGFDMSGICDPISHEIGSIPHSAYHPPICPQLRDPVRTV